MSRLQPKPDIPKNILDNASYKDNVISITTMFVSGDVIFKD
jgi:hypothetical protein